MNILSRQAVPPKLLFRRCLLPGVCLIILGAAAFLAHTARESAARDAKIRLGGDVEIRLTNQPFFLRADAFTRFNSRSLSRIMDMHTVARRGEEQIPVILKAIDRSYPLYGEMRFSDGAHEHPFARLRHQQAWGAAVEQSLLDRLAIKPGERIQVGGIELEVRAVIESEPDRGDPDMPRIMVSREAFMATGLPQAGAETRFRYRLTLLDGATLGEWRKRLNETFPNASWQVTEWTELAPGRYRWLSVALAAIAAAGLAMLIVLCRRCCKS